MSSKNFVLKNLTVSQVEAAAEVLAEYAGKNMRVGFDEVPDSSTQMAVRGNKVDGFMPYTVILRVLYAIAPDRTDGFSPDTVKALLWLPSTYAGITLNDAIPLLEGHLGLKQGTEWSMAAHELGFIHENEPWLDDTHVLATFKAERIYLYSYGSYTPFFISKRAYYNLDEMEILEIMEGFRDIVIGKTEGIDPELERQLNYENQMQSLN